MKTCSVEGCSTPSRSKNSAMCEKHYMRMYRHGTTEAKPISDGHTTSGGYRKVYAKGHPLRKGKSGPYEFEHRVNYYDKHGAGPFNCHWCGEVVDWGTLHIDHLDDSRDNNDVENLAATCPTCNQKRGRGKQRAAIVKKVGVLYEHDGIKETAGFWAERAGISRNAFMWRLKNGWSVADAVNTPRGKYGPASSG